MLWSVVVFILFSGSVLGLSSVQEDSSKCIEKILFWKKEHSKDVSPQFALGASIGLKLLIGSDMNSDPGIQSLIQQLKGVEEDYHQSADHSDVAPLLINSSIWLDRPMESQDPLSDLHFTWTSLQDYLDQIDLGHPNEEESDYCLNARMTSCDSNAHCDEVMKARDPIFGYRATHKLLYWIVSHQRTCDYSMKTVFQICCVIYDELLFLWTLLPDNPFLVDLFMEQLLLCGLVGFEEFLQRDYFQYIGQWLRTLNCNGNPLCNYHTFGVALAVECLATVI